LNNLQKLNRANRHHITWLEAV